jgi:hypothetical protein
MKGGAAMSAIATKINELASVIHKMPSKRYLNYLRSAEWERKRNEHLFWCDYMCEICDLAKACQVHHWTYERLGNEWPQDLCAVCVRCHHKLHCLIFTPAANDNFQLPLPFAVGDS